MIRHFLLPYHIHSVHTKWITFHSANKSHSVRHANASRLQKLFINDLIKRCSSIILYQLFLSSSHFFLSLCWLEQIKLIRYCQCGLMVSRDVQFCGYYELEPKNKELAFVIPVFEKKIKWIIRNYLLFLMIGFEPSLKHEFYLIHFLIGNFQLHLYHLSFIFSSFCIQHQIATLCEIAPNKNYVGHACQKQRFRSSCNPPI